MLSEARARQVVMERTAKYLDGVAAAALSLLDALEHRPGCRPDGAGSCRCGLDTIRTALRLDPPEVVDTPPQRPTLRARR